MQFHEAGHSSLRVLTQPEIDQNIDNLQNTRKAIFGEDVIIPFEEVKRHRALGQDIYSAYGDFTLGQPVKIRAIMHGFLISHASYDRIRAGTLDERELPPWEPRDGKAVLWIASCLSQVPRGATRVIDDALRLIQNHKYRSDMDTVAAFATTKGAVLARGMGLVEHSRARYKNDEPFFEFPLTPSAAEQLSYRTMNVFNCTDIRQMYSDHTPLPQATLG